MLSNQHKNIIPRIGEDVRMPVTMLT